MSDQKKEFVNPLTTFALTLLPTLTKHGKSYKTVIEVVALVCEIVETASLQIKQAGEDGIHGPVKAELAINIAGEVVEILHTKMMITEKLYQQLKGVIQDADLFQSYVSGIITLSNGTSIVQTARKNAVARSFLDCCSAPPADAVQVHVQRVSQK